MYEDKPRPIEFLLNGQPETVVASGGAVLLYVLRNDLCLNSPKYGCGLGECGACVVLIDDRVARSCQVAMDGVEGHAVTTLEGLARDGNPGPVQAAFIAEQAAQCGYCLNGMIMTAHALLSANPDPTDNEVAQALRFNLCRCGTHVEIMRAVCTAGAAIRAGTAR